MCLRAGPMFRHTGVTLPRSVTPQADCGCSGVAAEPRSARLRERLQNKNALKRFPALRRPPDARPGHGRPSPENGLPDSAGAPEHLQGKNAPGAGRNEARFRPPARRAFHTGGRTPRAERGCSGVGHETCKAERSPVRQILNRKTLYLLFSEPDSILFSSLGS